MKQSLQLRLGQYLTMTPQLQQAIRLLQLSTLELQAEVNEALETNPMLEASDEDEGGVEGEALRRNEQSAEREHHEESEGEGGFSDFEEFGGVDRERDLSPDQESTMPDDLAVDSVWEDVYDGATSYSRGEDDERVFEYADQSGKGLRDHLVWQLEMERFSDTDQVIASAIIDAIDDDGYLSMPLEEIRAGLVEDLDELDMAELEAVLHRVQRFDPVGVAARDLRECLLLQLEQYDPATPWLAETRLVVGEYLEVLGARDYKSLMRRLKLEEDDLAQVMALIRTLNPHPGSTIAREEPQYIIPDVFVRKVKGRWRVELNPEAAPKIRVNSLYASLLGRSGGGSGDTAALKGQLQEARWLVKSLQSRSETLLKVATTIVEQQRAFFEEGEEAMKPMVLRDIAEVVEMHESTISRITTQKYMHTPRGILEFKYFFSSHVGTTDGGEASSTAIRARIKKLIAQEEPRKPLSDNKLAELLEGEGIQVARRTVAKYREAMNIPPSNERRRLQ